MKAIILDMEFNQPSEAIIQIGATHVDLKTQKILTIYSAYSNPKETLDSRIIALTGITQEQVDTANSIPEVLEDFWAWVKDVCKCRYLFSWGTDYWKIINDSKEFKVYYPDRLKFLNIKEMSSVLKSILPSSKIKGGLKQSMETFGLEFVGKQHNALVDARNTALLLFYFVNCFGKYIAIDKITKGGYEANT